MPRKTKEEFLAIRSPGLADPEIRAKANATKKKNEKVRAAMRKSINAQAIADSIISDDKVQARIIDNITAIAMDPTNKDFKWANDLLVKNGLLNFTVKENEEEVVKIKPEDAKKKLMKLAGVDLDE